MERNNNSIYVKNRKSVGKINNIGYRNKNLTRGNDFKNRNSYREKRYRKK